MSLLNESWNSSPLAVSTEHQRGSYPVLGSLSRINRGLIASLSEEMLPSHVNYQYETNNDVVIRGHTLRIIWRKMCLTTKPYVPVTHWRQKTCRPHATTQQKWVNRTNPTLFNEFYTRKTYYEETTAVHSCTLYRVGTLQRLELRKHNTLVFLTCPRRIFAGNR